MSRKTRRQAPSHPLQIALRRQQDRERAQDPATWGLDADNLARAVNQDVQTQRDSAGRTVRARRQDVFDVLRARGRLSAAAVDAVRRLQDDIACLHRTATGGISFAPRVDRSVDPQGFSDARRRAGARIDSVLSLAGPASARLLGALCEPDLILGRGADWRAVVERETGETLADAQGAILRMACENLAGAYGILDRARTRVG